MASSLGPYNLSVVSRNVLKVLGLGQLGILSHILKSFYVPPIEQEAEMTTILYLLYPPSILDEIGNKKWLVVKVSLEILILSHY